MAANTANVLDIKTALDLKNIRASLMRMEDSIIFSLIERSQFKANTAVYEPDCSQLGYLQLHQLKSAGSDGCLGDWFIFQTECLHSQVRRYLHPTEYPFLGPLPEASLGSSSGCPASQDPILADVPPAAVVNQRLLNIFRTKMVPALCEPGDDGNHGSTAVQDVHCLRTMATRIYYGLFVAESKFRAEMDKASTLVRAGDREGLVESITKPEVEAKNVQRVILKARTFSQNIAAGEAGQLAPALSNMTTYKIDPEYIGTVFRDFIMPLTKDVEVEYLLNRLSGESTPQDELPSAKRARSA